MSQPNAAPTPTSHQTTGRPGWRRYAISPISQNGIGPSRSQLGFGAVTEGHGHHEGGQDHPASERRERGDYGPHVSIVGVICGKAP